MRPGWRTGEPGWPEAPQEAEHREHQRHWLVPSAGWDQRSQRERGELEELEERLEGLRRLCGGLAESPGMALSAGCTNDDDEGEKRQKAQGEFHHPPTIAHPPPT